MAGINLNGMTASNEVPPTLYPQFLSSTELKMQLLEVPVSLPDGSGKVSYREYFEKHHQAGFLELAKKYTIGLPGELIKLLQRKPEVYKQDSGDGKPVFLQLSFEEFEHFKRLESQMSVQSKEEEGVVELGFSMPHPLMAAEMTQAAESLLQQEIIEYKIQNAIVQLDFVSGQFEEKKSEFEKNQGRLADFRQRNQNIISPALLNQEQRLQAEYDFSFSIYTELAKQVEQARIQVSKDTPAFSVIQKVTVPIQKSSPNRPIILAAFLFFGVVTAISVSLAREMLVHLKKDWVQVNQAESGDTNPRI